VLRILEYSVPEDVKEHVSLVQPTTTFGLRAMTSHVRKLEGVPSLLMEDNSSAYFNTGAKGLNLAACDTTITPTCLAELYGFAPLEEERSSPASSNSLRSIGIWGCSSPSTHAPEAAKGNFTFVSFNGGKNTQNLPINATTRANLYVQYAVSITYPIKNTFFETGGRLPFTPGLEETLNDSEPYIEYLDYLLDQKSLPDVIATSYGGTERAVPYEYQIATSNKVARLGARGVFIRRHRILSLQ